MLPFQYSGGNADLAALAEGLSEEIVTGLSRFSYLRVIARSSTSRYVERGGRLARCVGRELGARYVMDGSLRQAGTKLRLAVQLVDADTGAHLWAETYERPFQPDDRLRAAGRPGSADRLDRRRLVRHPAAQHERGRPEQAGRPAQPVRGVAAQLRLLRARHARGACGGAPDAGAGRRAGAGPCGGLGHAVHDVRGGAPVRVQRRARSSRPLAPGRAACGRGRAVQPLSRIWLSPRLTTSARRSRPSGTPRSGPSRLNPMDGATVEYLGHLLAFAGDWERGCELGRTGEGAQPASSGLVLGAPVPRRLSQGRLPRRASLHAQGPHAGAVLLVALFVALYGQLGEHEAAAEALRELLALKPDFAEIARDQFGKWYRPELVEQLIDGLRKAGLDVPAPAQ